MRSLRLCIYLLIAIAFGFGVRHFMPTNLISQSEPDVAEGLASEPAEEDVVVPEPEPMAAKPMAAKPMMDKSAGADSGTPYPDLGRLYSRSAQMDAPYRNPVIVIPGLLGTKLEHEGPNSIVWGAFTGESINPTIPEQSRLFALPLDIESPIEDLKDEVFPTSVVESFHIQTDGIDTQHLAYFNILRMLGVGGFRDEALGLAGAIDYGDAHYTCFQFPYDWRKDNVTNAKRLHEFLIERKAYVEKQRKQMYGEKAEPVKFDVVAHSMGGLIGRYYLRYGNQSLEGAELNWAGCELVERMVLIGTPNLGAIESMQSVSEGFQFSPILPRYSAAMISTFPSIYQLLPRERQQSIVDSNDQPISIYDAKQWQKHQWGFFNSASAKSLADLLPSVTDRAEREEVASVFLQKCLDRAKLFHRAIDRDATPPQGAELHLFAGDATPTHSKLKTLVEGKRTATQVFEVVEKMPGDGTVTRASAIADERIDSDWTAALKSPIHFGSIHFMFTDHFGITRDPAFIDNALYLLLEKPRAKSSR